MTTQDTAAFATKVIRHLLVGLRPSGMRFTPSAIDFGTAIDKPVGTATLGIETAWCVFPARPLVLPLALTDIAHPTTLEAEAQLILSLRNKTVMDVEVFHPMPHLLLTFDDNSVLYVNGDSEHEDPWRVEQEYCDDETWKVQVLYEGDLAVWAPDDFMPELQFIVADIRLHRAEILALNEEYLIWVFAEINRSFGISCEEAVGMNAPEYAASVIDKICSEHPPAGVFYIMKLHGKLAGMGGLRRLSSARVEIKRIYVRPDCRGFQLGERMLKRLLRDATNFGYEEALLETGPFMKAAHPLYERAGFVDRKPYDEVEVPVAFHGRWRFMERSLKGIV